MPPEKRCLGLLITEGIKCFEDIKVIDNLIVKRMFRDMTIKQNHRRANSKPNWSTFLISDCTEHPIILSTIVKHRNMLVLSALPIWNTNSTLPARTVSKSCHGFSDLYFYRKGLKGTTTATNLFPESWVAEHAAFQFLKPFNWFW